MGEDLADRLLKELEVEQHLAGEHRIFAQDGVRGLRIAQPLHERGEALLRSRAREELLETGHVQFEDEGPREERQEAVGKGRRGHLEGALHGEWEGAGGLGSDRREIVPQAPPGALDQGADQLQETRGGADVGGDRQRRQSRIVRSPAVGDLGHPGRRRRAEPLRRQGHQALERLLGQAQAFQVPLPPGAGLEGGQGPPLFDPLDCINHQAFDILSSSKLAEAFDLSCKRDSRGSP